VVLDDEQPLLGPNGRSQGHTTAAAAVVGLGMVVVSGRNVLGQCLAIAIIINQCFNY
jgi:hypothetical protein